MHYYNLTIKQAGSISHACVGQFLAKRDDYKLGHFEIATAKGRFLEILKPDIKTGKLHSIICVNVFGIIRSMAAFRLTGGFKDFLIIGSESGRIVILEYSPEKNAFINLHQETFGRSGIRRIVPGQYLACDSKGRAVMLGAVEKQKLVYQLNRDTQANLTISSPLEANKSNTILFYMINVDVGYENPLFACLELDYEQADEDQTGNAAKETKLTLTYYELDLGLNHVVKNYSEQLDNYANMLIQVPGGDDGPSGVLVCFENFIVYKNFGEQIDVKCPIPRRKGETDVRGRGILVACSATYKYLQGDKRCFCFYIQTELGDIFKTDFIFGGKRDELVREIRMVYFDTLPVASALCLLPHSRRRLEGGLMFVAAENGDHLLYQIESADDEQSIVFSSKSYESYLAQKQAQTNGDGSNHQKQNDDEDSKFFQFKPTDLRHLESIDHIRSLAPTLSTDLFNNLDEHRLLVACGSGKNSTLRVLRHGLQVTKGQSSSLPSEPTGIWSIRRRCDSQSDEYIVVSFTNATLVLGVDETFSEVVDSGFLGTKQTIGCAQLGDDSLIQVHPDGIRHIHADKRVSEWRVGVKYKVLKCAVNNRQVIIYSSEKKLIYFEMDSNGQLNEFNEPKHFSSEISCLALNELSLSDTRSRFLAVGLELKVLILSLDLDDCLTEITRITLPSAPESMCVSELGGSGVYADMHNYFGAASNLSGQLYLNIGLHNGELMRTAIDRVTGDLSELPIRRFLGIRPVRLHNVRVKNRMAVLASTSKSWLLYKHQNRANLSPLSCEPIDHATSVNSPLLGECILAVINKELLPLHLEGLGDIYNHQLHKLDATPRKFVLHPESGNVITMLTDRLPLLIDPSEPEYTDKWRSQIQLMDPISGEVYRVIRYESHQAALSLSLASFGTSSTSVHVGVSNYYSLKRQCAQSNEIYSYALINRSCDLELLHRTECPGSDIPRAMCELQDRLVVGIGRIVRIYDLGKKKLLRKCENHQIPFMVIGLSASSNRLFVSDAHESITFMKYRKNENTLRVFADDTYPRHMVSMAVINSNSVAGGDKFGNIFVLDLAEDVNPDLIDNPGQSLWDRGLLGGASQKADVGAIIHIGEMVTSIKHVSLNIGRPECILYTTINGTIGALVSLEATEFEYFQTLEMHMRQECPPLCGRDHLSFSSTYFPVKNIIDGHMCESFLSLNDKSQQRIADEMEKKLHEVSKSLDEMIDRIL